MKDVKSEILQRSWNCAVSGENFMKSRNLGIKLRLWKNKTFDIIPAVGVILWM